MATPPFIWRWLHRDHAGKIQRSTYLLELFLRRAHDGHVHLPLHDFARVNAEAVRDFGPTDLRKEALDLLDRLKDASDRYLPKK